MGVSRGEQLNRQKERLTACIPSRGLAATNVGVGLLCLLAEAGRTIRVLLADGLAIRQVLCAVDDKHKRTNDRAVDAEVGEDASGVRPVKAVGLCLGRHLGVWRGSGLFTCRRAGSWGGRSGFARVECRRVCLSSRCSEPLVHAAVRVSGATTCGRSIDRGC